MVVMWWKLPVDQRQSAQDLQPATKPTTMFTTFKVTSFLFLRPFWSCFECQQLGFTESTWLNALCCCYVIGRFVLDCSTWWSGRLMSACVLSVYIIFSFLVLFRLKFSWREKEKKKAVSKLPLFVCRQIQSQHRTKTLCQDMSQTVIFLNPEWV